MSDTTSAATFPPVLKVIVGVALLTMAYLGGYHFSSGSDLDTTATAGTQQAKQEQTPLRSAAVRTSSLALPDKTDNAWQITPFTLSGLDDQNHSLSDWKGKVIMLNFWATWCPPCQYEVPEFIRYQKEYSEKGLQIIGIGIDQKRKLKNFVRTMEINYPVLVSSESDSTKLLKSWGNSEQILPYTVIIDRDGTIQYIHRGQFNEFEFEEYVLPLLG